MNSAVFSFRSSGKAGIPHVDVTFFLNEDQTWNVWVYAVPKGKGARGNRRMLGSYNSANPPDPEIANTFLLLALNNFETSTI